jgi:hypothetical protein
LTTIESRLSRIEFGEQAVGDTLIVDESLLRSVLDACFQGSYRWGMHTIIGRLCSSCSCGEQTKPNKCYQGNKCYYYKTLFHVRMPPFEINWCVRFS